MSLNPRVANAIVEASRCICIGNFFSKQLFEDELPHVIVGVLYPEAQPAYIKVEVEASSEHPAVLALIDLCASRPALFMPAVVEAQEPTYTCLRIDLS